MLSNRSVERAEFSRFSKFSTVAHSYSWPAPAWFADNDLQAVQNIYWSSENVAMANVGRMVKTVKREFHDPLPPISCVTVKL